MEGAFQVDGRFGANAFLCINSPVNTTLQTVTLDAASACAGGPCVFNATGLLQDTAYDFRVVPHNAIGSTPIDQNAWLIGDGSPISGFPLVQGCDASCFFTLAGAPKVPPTPDTPSVIAVGQTTATLQWTVPGATVLGRVPNIVRYYLTTATVEDGTNSTSTVAVSYSSAAEIANGVTVSETVTSLTPNTNYTFSLQAVNKPEGSGGPDGLSPQGIATGDVLTLGSAPDAVGLTTPIDTTNVSALVQWAAPPAYGVAIEGYELQLCRVTCSDCACLDETNYTVSDTTSYELALLTPRSMYAVRARASSSFGVGAFGPRATFSTTGAPDAVGSLTAAGRSTVFVQVSWTAPAVYGAPLEAYEVEVNNGTKFVTVDAAVTNHVEETNPAQTVWFRVRGRNVYGWGGWSPSLSIFSLPPRIPTTPLAPGVSALSWFELTLAWTVPSETPAIESYELLVTRDGASRRTPPLPPV